MTQINKNIHCFTIQTVWLLQKQIFTLADLRLWIKFTKNVQHLFFLGANGWNSVSLYLLMGFAPAKRQKGDSAENYDCLG